jgi:hypothetical protein
MTKFNRRLVEILDNLPDDNRNVMIIRLLIMLKLNEMVHYQNCKDCVMDTKGKYLMEYLAEEQKKYIMQLEELAPDLPEELKKDFRELSEIMMTERTEGLSAIQGVHSTESSKVDFSFMVQPLDDVVLDQKQVFDSDADVTYLLTSIQKKGNELKLVQNLTDCLHDKACSEFFIQILEDEKNYHQMLIHNFNVLQNTGKWVGI